MKVITEGSAAAQMAWWIGKICTCSVCGSQFELEPGDSLQVAYDDSTGQATQATVVCPTATCHNVVTVLPS